MESVFTKKNFKYKTVSWRLPEEDYELVDEMVKEDRASRGKDEPAITASDILRDAIDMYLKKIGRKGKNKKKGKVTR